MHQEFLQKADSIDFENQLKVMQLTKIDFQTEKLQLLSNNSKKALWRINLKLALLDACLWGKKARLEATKLDQNYACKPCGLNTKLGCQPDTMDDKR